MMIRESNVVSKLARRGQDQS